MPEEEARGDHMILISTGHWALGGEDGLVGGRFWLGEAPDDFSIGDLPVLDRIGEALPE